MLYLKKVSWEIDFCAAISNELEALVYRRSSVKSIHICCIDTCSYSHPRAILERYARMDPWINTRDTQLTCHKRVVHAHFPE